MFHSPPRPFAPCSLLLCSVACASGSPSAGPTNVPSRTKTAPASIPTEKEPKTPALESQVSTGLGTAVGVVVSQSHVCALLSSGKVACWGQLNGSLEPIRTWPTLVEGVDDAVAIHAGDCITRHKGPAMCWKNELVAKEVPGTEGARDIAEGEWQPCFVLASGSISCLETGTLKPVQGLSKVKAFSDWGYNEFCTLHENNRIRCLDASDRQRYGAAKVHPDALDVIRLEQSAGCVKRKGDVLTCFGAPHVTRDLPRRVHQIFLQGQECLRTDDQVSCRERGEDEWVARNVGGPASDLSCQGNTCCAIVKGSVSCWGNNEAGLLGDGFAGHRSLPTQVEGLPPVSAVAASGGFTMAMTKSGELFAWGRVGRTARLPKQIYAGEVALLALGNYGAAVGKGRKLSFVSASREGFQVSSLPSLPSPAVALSVDDEALVCAALKDGTTRCLSHREADTRWQLAKGMRNIKQLSAIADSTCGVSKKGGLFCLLGTDEEEDETQSMSRLRGQRVTGVANARRVTIPYVELGDGRVLYFQLEDGKSKLEPLPSLAKLGGIATGGFGWSPTCGVRKGRAECFVADGSGKDEMGSLGRGPGDTSSERDIAPVASELEAKSVSAGGHHACLVDKEAQVWCWGSDRHGQLGLGREVWREDAKAVVGIGL